MKTAFLLAVVAASAAMAEEPSATYRVTFSDSNPTLARVDATLPVTDDKIWMAGWGADMLANGWASNVRDLVVENGTAKLVEKEPRWNIEAAGNRVHITYSVDLSFARSKWPYGNEQAGIFQNDALFVVSKALFIVSDAVTSARVDIDAPQRWRVSTPWKRRDTRSFIAESRDDLIDNSLVVGGHTEYVFREKGFTLIVALLGEARAARTLVADTLRKSLQSYLKVFPKTRPASYLITLFYGDEADAEAFSRSAAFTEHDRLRSANVIRWGNTVAHELFHAWNGHAIQSADYAPTQWFTEGFTEYFANRALLREHVITPALYRSKMEKVLGLYLYFRVSPAFPRVSLRQAGSNKGPHRLGVYNGGWAAAFCLDDVIRTSSHGERDLITLMRLMYERFGLTGKKYTYEDLITAASDTAGKDLHEWFAAYVSGTEMLPVLDALHRVGYEGYTQFYDGELYIAPRRATP